MFKKRELAVLIDSLIQPYETKYRFRWKLQVIQGRISPLFKVALK